MLFKGTIDALKRLLKFIDSKKFREEYGELFIIPAKLNQDFVESFFSTQRQMCGGTQNMTAYVYACNINGYSCFQIAKALGKSRPMYKRKDYHTLIVNVNSHGEK